MQARNSFSSFVQYAQRPPSKVVPPHQHAAVVGRGIPSSPGKSTVLPERAYLLLSPAFPPPLLQARRSAAPPRNVPVRPAPGTSHHNRTRVHLAQHTPLLSEEYCAPGPTTPLHSAQVDPGGTQGSSSPSPAASSTGLQ